VRTSEALRDAVRYWEPRRLWYNLALTVLVIAWVVFTWPHFQPSFTLPNLVRLLGLAALANLCYCAAYLVDIPMQESPARAVWRQRRWILWLFGTLLALFVAYYWIGDEIYPYVGAA
jgi:cytochrome bd-type quinol oxidase subunit 2